MFVRVLTNSRLTESGGNNLLQDLTVRRLLYRLSNLAGRLHEVLHKRTRRQEADTLGFVSPFKTAIRADRSSLVTPADLFGHRHDTRNKQVVRAGSTLRIFINHRRVYNREGAYNSVILKDLLPGRLSVEVLLGHRLASLGSVHGNLSENTVSSRSVTLTARLVNGMFTKGLTDLSAVHRRSYINALHQHVGDGGGSAHNADALSNQLRATLVSNKSSSRIRALLGRHQSLIVLDDRVGLDVLGIRHDTGLLHLGFHLPVRNERRQVKRVLRRRTGTLSLH